VGLACTKYGPVLGWVCARCVCFVACRDVQHCSSTTRTHRHGSIHCCRETPFATGKLRRNEEKAGPVWLGVIGACMSVRECPFPRIVWIEKLPRPLPLPRLAGRPTCTAAPAPVTPGCSNCKRRNAKLGRGSKWRAKAQRTLPATRCTPAASGLVMRPAAHRTPGPLLRSW
jgi:hypothetical protein